MIFVLPLVVLSSFVALTLEEPKVPATRQAHQLRQKLNVQVKEINRLAILSEEKVQRRNAPKYKIHSIKPQNRPKEPDGTRNRVINAQKHRISFTEFENEMKGHPKERIQKRNEMSFLQSKNRMDRLFGERDKLKNTEQREMGFVQSENRLKACTLDRYQKSDLTQSLASRVTQPKYAFKGRFKAKDTIKNRPTQEYRLKVVQSEKRKQERFEKKDKTIKRLAVMHDEFERGIVQSLTSNFARLDSSSPVQMQHRGRYRDVPASASGNGRHGKQMAQLHEKNHQVEENFKSEATIFVNDANFGLKKFMVSRQPLRTSYNQETVFSNQDYTELGGNENNKSKHSFWDFTGQRTDREYKDETFFKENRSKHRGREKRSQNVKAQLKGISIDTNTLCNTSCEGSVDLKNDDIIPKTIGKDIINGDLKQTKNGEKLSLVNVTGQVLKGGFSKVSTNGTGPMAAFNHSNTSCADKCGLATENPDDCSCDLLCFVYKTCCDDVAKFCRDLKEEAKVKLKSLFLSENETIEVECDAALDIFVVTSCGRNFEAVTMDLSKTPSLKEEIYVSDPVTGLVFRNLSVYYCHYPDSKHQPKFWKAVIESPRNLEFQDFEKLWKMLRHEDRYYVPPSSALEGQTCQIGENIIKHFKFSSLISFENDVQVKVTRVGYSGPGWKDMNCDEGGTCLLTECTFPEISRIVNDGCLYKNGFLLSFNVPEEACQQSYVGSGLQVRDRDTSFFTNVSGDAIENKALLYERQQKLVYFLTCVAKKNIVDPSTFFQHSNIVRRVLRDGIDMEKCAYNAFYKFHRYDTGPNMDLLMSNAVAFFLVRSGMAVGESELYYYGDQLDIGHKNQSHVNDSDCSGLGLHKGKSYDGECIVICTQTVYRTGGNLNEFTPCYSKWQALLAPRANPDLTSCFYGNASSPFLTDSFLLMILSLYLPLIGFSLHSWYA